MKYKKKAVVIEAFKWTGGPDQDDDPIWAIEAIKRGDIWFNAGLMKIRTLEGIHAANPGDFIIQGVKGEIYPCKPDIFAITYEAVEDLPESKPEPEKNCGNCGAPDAFCHTEADEKFCKSWQPKPAEPQGWEQRLNAMVFVLVRDGLRRGGQGHQALADIRELIRAEIERVHAGYAPLICAIEMAFKEADFLPDGRLTRKARAVFEPIRQAEQNRRGEG